MNLQSKIIFLLIIILSAAVSYGRNSIWHSDMTLWTDVSARSPQKAKPYNGLGVVYSDLGMKDKAIKSFSKAIKLKPGFYVASSNLGAELFRKGLYSEAQKAFENAISYEFNYPEAHNNLGATYALLGQMDKAIIEFKISLDQNPNYIDAMLNLARANILDGKTGLASQLIDKILSTEPTNKNALELKSIL